MLLVNQVILVNRVLFAAARIAPLCTALLVSCSVIDHDAIGYSDQRKLHIGERTDIAVCILEFRMKRCTDAGGFMLCGTPEQRETEQKRYELFHWYCPKEFVYGEGMR